VFRSFVVNTPKAALSLTDFTPDTPWERTAIDVGTVPHELIDGVTLTPIVANSDERGSLSELLTTRDGPIEPIVHVYQVTSMAGSIRAWVYHRKQFDRLAFINGRFKIALYDIRPGSPSANRVNVLVLGSEHPALLRIPPLVIHGVGNIGAETATFVNLPTRAYDPRDPDKCRLRVSDPRMPFRFDDL
jgi:dTDP-4-dehydrorhamnose 3,5-epimerase